VNAGKAFAKTGQSARLAALTCGKALADSDETSVTPHHAVDEGRVLTLPER
jgi:hypothetical protein